MTFSEFDSPRCGQTRECHGDDDAKADYPTQVGEDIAVHGVEGEIAAIAVLGGQRGEGMAWDAGGEASIGIDDGGDAGVGVAQQPAAIFNRAHARHVQAFARARRCRHTSRRSRY